MCVTVVVFAAGSLASVPALAKTSGGGGQTSTAAADRSTAPQTPWGAPDLQGIWDFRTLTPLQRPGAFEGKDVLTDAEAAEFEQQTVQNLDADRRDGGARRDVERAYNDFWWD